jgi:hypothetical protein
MEIGSIELNMYRISTVQVLLRSEETSDDNHDDES